MSQTWQDALSARVMAMKTRLGSLVELVESWVLSLSNEEERFRRLKALEELIENPASGLNSETLAQAREHLAALIGRGQDRAYASVSFRQRLQGLFREAIERLNTETDDLLKQIGKLASPSGVPGGDSSGFIMAQEDERKRISREIHDGPAQHLASLTMRIDYILERADKPEVLREELPQLKESITRCLKDIRRFIFDLRPMALDDLGLLPTLEQFIQGFKARTGMIVQLSREGEIFNSAPEKELAIFRVIQEAVNNAHRHAHAKIIRIFITFDHDKSQIQVAITDDGHGFDLPAIRKAYHSLRKLGLLSMEERVRLAGGEFTIVSTPGEGTVVSFSVPK